MPGLVPITAIVWKGWRVGRPWTSPGSPPGPERHFRMAQAGIGEHALLDLCYPMFGKIEYNLTRRCYLWMCAGFPLTLAETYRARLAEDHGVRFADPDWDAALASCLYFSFLTQLGRAVDLRQRDKPLAFPERDYEGMTGRLLSLDSGWSAYPALRALLARLST